MYVTLLAAVNVQWIILPALSVIFCLGLLAMLSPGHFAAIAMRGSRWIDTEKVLQALDKPIDVDRHVLRYSRVFGLLVALSAAWLAWVSWAVIP